MSTSSLTLIAIGAAAAATTLVVIIDALQPARSIRLPWREREPTGPVQLVQMPTEPYRTTPWWRRVIAVVSAGFISLVVGLVLATVVVVALTVGLLVLREAVG